MAHREVSGATAVAASDKTAGLDRSAVCRRIAAAFATLRNVMAPWQDFAA